MLRGFINKLRRSLDGFKHETPEAQEGMAILILSATNKTRRHKANPDALSISYKEKEQRFGRGKFEEINGRLGVFNYTPYWSAQRNLTKEYTLTPKTQQILDGYLLEGRSIVESLMAGGKRVRTLPKAIAAKDMDGNTLRVWAGVDLPNKVAVDRPALLALREQLRESRVHSNLFGDYTPIQLEHLQRDLAKILRMSKVDVAGEGYVPQRHQEAPSGRLYGTGIHLQNMPTPIRQAALHGLFDYDIENCHFAIFSQMAARFGFDCPHIRHYIGNKAAVRQQIAAEVGIEVDGAKKCLLAIMYGAHVTLYSEAKIPETIGSDAAARLYQHPLFCQIRDEVVAGGKAIIAGWPRREKTLVNDGKKSIKTSSKPKQLLAHLTQGVEALMLRAAFNEYPQDIVLLQHDGFTSTKPLDKGRIERAILTATGYTVELSEDQVVLAPDLGASRYTGR